jgi:ketosteroid isomerase-like protein
MTTDFDEVLEQAFAALDQIARGDSTGYKALYSRRDDITLANPFGGVGRGWNDVVERLDRAALVYTDGRATGFEIVTQAVTSELAYTVAIERIEAKVGGQLELAPIAVRVTCVYRREDSGWKLVHRHADPRVNPQTAESVLQP